MVIEELAGLPPGGGISLKAVKEEVVALWAQSVGGNGWALPVAQLEHDLEVIVVF